jgi:hypothetical protein
VAHVQPVCQLLHGRFSPSAARLGGATHRLGRALAGQVVAQRLTPEARCLDPSLNAVRHRGTELPRPTSAAQKAAPSCLALRLLRLGTSATALAREHRRGADTAIRCGEAHAYDFRERNEAMAEYSNTVDILALHQRADAAAHYRRIGSAAAGLILSGAAALTGRGTRSLTRVLLATAGGLLIARGVSGWSVQQLSAAVRKLFTHRTDLEKRFNDGEHDIVDAASFDSFPASDPPSYSPGVG